MPKKQASKASNKTLGRPPIAQGLVRNNRVVTFVTDEQLTKINTLANNQHKSLSATCHEILTDYLAKH